MITERFLMILMLLALPLHVSSATFRVVVGPKGGTTCIFDYPTSPLSPADVRSLYQCTSIIFQSVLSRRHLHSIWEMFDYFNPYPHPGLHELRIEHIESPLFNAVLATLLSGRVRVQIHQVVINAWGSIDRHSLPPIQYCRPNLHRLMIPQCQLSDQMAKEMRLLLPGMEIISALSASGPASAQRSAMTPKPPSSKTQSVASGKKSATISGFGIESAPYYPGLVNMGNTCYLNSVVQTLFYLRPFRKSIFRTTLSVGTITNGLRNLFANLYERIEKGEWAVIRPTGFVPLVGRLWNQERVNEQNDAPEFMEWLLRRINEETGGSAGITNLYQGRLRKEISCTKVKCQSISHDLFQGKHFEFTF
jgi:hypothetical protein